MDRLVIKGKADLKGSIKIKGSKNSALPIMVSALLSKNTLKLKNLPKLDDIKNMSKLLRSYGAIIKKANGQILLMVCIGISFIIIKNCYQETQEWVWL